MSSTLCDRHNPNYTIIDGVSPCRTKKKIMAGERWRELPVEIEMFFSLFDALFGTRSCLGCELQIISLDRIINVEQSN